MPLDTKNLAALKSFSDGLPSTERLQGLAGLAGNTIARPFAQLRENQAKREAERVSLLEGANSPRALVARATADAATLQISAIGNEIARLRLEPPEPDEGEVGVYGYIRRAGKPATGYAVALLGDNDTQVANTRSGEDGSFSLLVKSDALLKLAVFKGKEQVFADRVAVIDAGPIARYRMVDLPGAKSGGSKRDDDAGLGETPENLRGLVGLTLNRALTWLATHKLELARLLITPRGPQSGHVVRADGDGRQVRLWISLPDQDAEQLDPLAVLIAASPMAARIGLGTIAAAREALRTAETKSLHDAGDLLRLSDRDLSEKLGLKGIEQGKVMRELLELNLKLIELE